MSCQIITAYVPPPLPPPFFTSSLSHSHTHTTASTSSPPTTLSIETIIGIVGAAVAGLVLLIICVFAFGEYLLVQFWLLVFWKANFSSQANVGLCVTHTLAIHICTHNYAYMCIHTYNMCAHIP